MRTIREYITEKLEESKAAAIAEAEKQALLEAEKSIKDEESFRKYAEEKFKKAFGDDLDEKKMNDTIDGILKDNKEDADNGDWGKLVGILNKSFD